MKDRLIVRVLLAIWSVLFTVSFLIPPFVEPSGDGFTRGLNRVTVFVQWQLGACFFAVILLLLGIFRVRDTRRWKLLTFAPAVVHASLVLLVVVFVVYVNVTSRPATHAEPAASPEPTARPEQETVAEPVGPPAQLAEAATAEGAVDVQTFRGVYRSGFESSHFYTMDGRGPWWLEASGEEWDALQEHYVERPGRGGSVTVALTLDGWLEEVGDDLMHLGPIEKRLHLVSIQAMRPITPGEFERILNAIQARSANEGTGSPTVRD